MFEEKDFQQRLRRIGALVEELETIADPAARSSARQLVQLVMEFHGAAVNRALEILANGGGPGMAFIDQLGRDPMVSSLLILYGLHPETIETRVRKAVEGLEPKLRRDGAALELLENSGGAVRVRVTPGAHACGSTTKALQSAVEEAIYEAAPDILSLSIEGLEGKMANGFVALEKLASQNPQSASVASQGQSVGTNYGD
ncbi:MAG TPA: NifU family protein [Terriglobales bacterium]|jgi:Fe-S cluster biogenesis protein NfuA|nr:NifU family protein [Terriglobales bacterium]